MTKPLRTIVGVVGAATVLAACGAADEPDIDLQPIGDGLRFLGICAVVAVLVAVLSTLRRGGGPHG